MFYHLKPWKSWQVFSFSFMKLLRNSKQKSIWWNFKFNFWLKTSKSEHLCVRHESILQRTIKRTHIIKTHGEKIKRIKIYQPQWKNIHTLKDVEFWNFKNSKKNSKIEFRILKLWKSFYTYKWDIIYMIC
jgi:hypothetical protein